MDDVLLAPTSDETHEARIARLARSRPADIAEALNREEPAVAAKILEALPTELAVETLDHPELDDGPAVLTAMPRSVAAALLSALSTDRAADIFRELEDPCRSELLALVDADTRETVGRLLSYPEASAGAIMTAEFVGVPANWTIAEVLQHLHVVERTRETIYSVYVLDPAKQILVQSVTLRRLISGDPHANVLTAAPNRPPVTVLATDSREEATRLISKYNLLAVPVIDKQGHVLGIVTVDDVIDEIVRRQTDEVQRFGGSEALGEPYLQVGFLAMIRKRAGWLCALFLSEMLTASAMQTFEGELEKAIVLTLFIPLIMSSGGNSGSQATSLLIRALALREIKVGDWWRVALREIPMGFTLGAILGVIGIIRITTWQYLGFYNYGIHWPLVALTVGSALVGIVMFGSLMGSMLPFALQRLGFDPASASAPFVATLVDVTGLVIYFGVAATILHGTLL